MADKGSKGSVYGEWHRDVRDPFVDYEKIDTRNFKNIPRSIANINKHDITKLMGYARQWDVDIIDELEKIMEKYDEEHKKKMNEFIEEIKSHSINLLNVSNDIVYILYDSHIFEMIKSIIRKKQREFLLKELKPEDPTLKLLDRFDELKAELEEKDTREIIKEGEYEAEE